MTEPDPLDELRKRIHATQDAAARFADEAAGARAEASAGRTPPAGWATADEQSARTDELRALMTLLESLRDLLPDDLRDQFRDLVKQMLLLLRALIDWWVARMDEPAAATAARRAPARDVQDIPVD